MTIAKALLLFLGLAAAEALLVQVEVSKTGYHVYAGEMKYKKPWDLKRLDELEEVRVYYIDAQKTFFFSKTLGATLSRLGSPDDRIPMHQERLSLDKKDDNIRVYRGEVNMENVNKETRSNMEIKTIFRSPTTLHLYIGESLYFRVFTVIKRPTGGAVMSFGEEFITISDAQFFGFQARRAETLRFMYGTSEVVSTAFEWTSPESGLAVVRIGDRSYETFRVSGLERPNDSFLVDILKFHPYYELEFNAALQDAPTLFFRSTAQEAFVSTFTCDASNALKTVTISREKKDKFVAITSMSIGNKFQLMNLPQDVIQEMKLMRRSQDKLFDFSVLLGRSDANVDFRVNTEVDNRHVYFRIRRQDDAVTLTLMTLNAKLGVVSKLVKFDEVPAHPLALFFIIADENGADLKRLQYVRKVRLHTDMFDERDFCNNLHAAPLINKHFVNVPDANGHWDAGFIYALTDPDSRLNLWHHHVFTETIKNKKTGVEETFTSIVFYDPKFAGLLALGAKSVTLQAPSMSRMPFRNSLVAKDLPRFDKPDLVIPDSVGKYDTNIHILDGEDLASVFTMPINPKDPSLVYFHANARTANFLTGDIELAVKNLNSDKFHGFFFSLNQVIKVRARAGRVTLTHRHRSIEFAADYIKGNDCKIRIIYKKGNTCTVIDPFPIGSTVDYPDDSMVLINLGLLLRVELSQTQIFELEENKFMLVLTPFDTAPLSEAQFEGVTFDKSQNSCAIPSERGLQFAVTNNAFFLFNAQRSLRFRAALTSVNSLLSLQTYQFEKQKAGRFQLKKSEDVDLSDRKGDILQTGLISDLNTRLETLFFGPNANYFNRPVVHFSQKGDSVSLWTAYESATMTVRVRTDAVVLELPGSDPLPFVLSAPAVHSLDNSHRYFRLTLHFFGLDFEDITSSLEFKDTEGVSSEGFDHNKFEYAFEIPVNSAPEYLSALTAALRSRLHSVHFSAEVFANKNSDLVVLVHEQTRVSYHRLVDGVLQDEESLLTISKNKNLPQKLQAKVKKDFFSQAVSLNSRDSASTPSILVKSTDLVHPTANSVCTDAECFPIGIFAGVADNTFHIIARPGEFRRIQSSEKALTVSALNSLNKADGFNVVEHSSRLLL